MTDLSLLFPSVSHFYFALPRLLTNQLKDFFFVEAAKVK
jgi:hypothetical protein